jgi:hypothetical protein
MLCRSAWGGSARCAWSVAVPILCRSSWGRVCTLCLVGGCPHPAFGLWRAGFAAYLAPHPVHTSHFLVKSSEKTAQSHRPVSKNPENCRICGFRLILWSRLPRGPFLWGFRDTVNKPVLPLTGAVSRRKPVQRAARWGKCGSKWVFPAVSPSRWLSPPGGPSRGRASGIRSPASAVLPAPSDLRRLSFQHLRPVPVTPDMPVETFQRVVPRTSA